ncbi:MAG: hypothetical protein AAF432_13810 [Planctomycetota bacterium]
MNCNCCQQCGTRTTKHQRGSVLGTLFKLAIVYIVLIFAGGTLQRVNHPVAVEAGNLVHTVTLINPAIAWADNVDADWLATGLRVASNGMELS